MGLDGERLRKRLHSAGRTYLRYLKTQRRLRRDLDKKNRLEAKKKADRRSSRKRYVRTTVAAQLCSHVLIVVLAS